MNTLIIILIILGVVCVVAIYKLIPNNTPNRNQKIDILIAYLKENYKCLPVSIFQKLNKAKSCDTNQAQHLITQVAEYLGQKYYDKHTDCLLIEIGSSLILEKIEQKNNKEE